MSSLIEISRAALAANLRAVRQAAGAAEVLAMIKADGYGHGGELLAEALATLGVGWMGVSTVQEGARIRARLPDSDLRILLMVGPEATDAAGIVRERLTPAVWTAEQIARLDAASDGGEPLPVHLEIDTGMSRQGAKLGDDLAHTLAVLAAAKHLHCEGVFTHFAESETAGSALSARQMTLFAEALAQVRSAGFRPRWVHAANSSAVDTAEFRNTLEELAAAADARVLVRPGLALLGYALPTGGVSHLQPELVPALTWSARVLDLRDIAAGATVGYGATFHAARPMRLALLPVGYADGFRREASSGLGNGWVMLSGQRAPVVGRVSMNLTVVNVTAIPGVAVGDEAVLLGPGVSAEDHARWCDTIAYEILCGLRAESRVLG